MLCWSKPGQALVARLLDAQRTRPYSYAEAGATRGPALSAPAGYGVLHSRARLGQGSEAFERARRALAAWKMFDMPWIELYWPNAPIAAGATVAVAISHFGFWSVNLSRIVYVIEESGPVERFGFAYGTLPEHEEIGEERFTVEFHAADQSVWYDLYSFSRPGSIARMGYPLAKMLQRRFVCDSVAAMQKAVGHGD
jgi:uncharacterized protein (UPF0548 family)